MTSNATDQSYVLGGWVEGDGDVDTATFLKLLKL